MTKLLWLESKNYLAAYVVDNYGIARLHILEKGFKSFLCRTLPELVQDVGWEVVGDL